MKFNGLFHLERPDAEELAESPIEKRMLDILQDICPWRITPGYFQVQNLDEAREIVRQRSWFLSHTCLIFPQVPVLRYRLDFLVAYAPRSIPITDELFDPVMFALECDGKEAHRGRLAYDMQRDREIRVATGLPTVRVEGSDIYRRPGRVLYGLSRMLRAIERVQLARLRVRDAPDFLGEDENDPLAMYETARQRTEKLQDWYGWDWEMWATHMLEGGDPYRERYP